MIDFANKKTGPIGLDIGHNSIKMIQLVQSNEKMRIYAIDEIRFDPEVNSNDQMKTDFVISAIREICSRVKFHGTDVVASLPSHLVKIKSLRLDTSDDEQIEQVVKTEVADTFNLNPEIDQIKITLHKNKNDLRDNEEITIDLFNNEKKVWIEHNKKEYDVILIPIEIDRN